MSYEAWRISFQNSEQAAKAAFEEAQRYKRMFNMSIDSIVELTEAVGIRKEDQTMGGTVQTLAAIEKLKARRDKWKARALEAEQGNRGEPSPSTTLALRDVLQHAKVANGAAHRQDRPGRQRGGKSRKAQRVGRMRGVHSIRSQSQGVPGIPQGPPTHPPEPGSGIWCVFYKMYGVLPSRLGEWGCVEGRV